MHKKHFLFKTLMLSNMIDLLTYYVVKKYFFIFNILPLEFFENLTFKWVPLIGFWVKIILFYVISSFYT